MTMQVFKYCWHSKDFLSPLNDKSIIPQCQGNRMSLICQMQNQMWFKKRNRALSFFQVLDVCPYAPHLQRKHLWESSPVDRLGSCFRHMSVCHITSADRASTRPATSSNIPTCWIHRGSSNQWDSPPTGMDTATQGGKPPTTQTPRGVRNPGSKTFMWSCVPALAQTRWQEDYRLPWQPVRVGGLLPKLFFHCAPGCCGYPWTHTTPVQTPSNPTAIQCTTAVSVAQMLRRQRTAEFFWFLSCFCDSSAPPLSFPPIHKLLLQVLLPSSKYSLPLCPSASPFQLNVSVGCFLLPQSPPSQLIIRLYFTSLLIPLYFWILPHPTTKPPCSISSVQRLPRTPPQQVDYGFSHQYLISSLSWLLHNIFCWYLSTASFSSPCACVMMCFKRKTLSSRLHSMPLPRLSTATSSHAANLEVRPSLLASQPSTAAQRTVGLRWD